MNFNLAQFRDRCFSLLSALALLGWAWQVVSVLVLGLVSMGLAQAAPTVYSIPGAWGYTVPAGVTSVKIVATGGAGSGRGAPGGHGAVVTVTLPVSPLQDLNLFVGGGGAFTNSGRNGAGGGSSNVDAGTAHQIIAGGGGGGSSSCSGGNGGVNADGSGGNGGCESGGPGLGGHGGTGGAGGGGGSEPGVAGGNGNGGPGGSTTDSGNAGGLGSGSGAGGNVGGSWNNGAGGGGYGGGGSAGSGTGGGGAGGSTGPSGAVYTVGSNGGTAGVAGGNGSISIEPGLSVTGVSPSSLSTAGGLVTISGVNFVSGATVTIGGVAATGVTFVDSGTLTATVPAGSVGAAVDVVVTNQGADTRTGTLLAGFTYNPTVSFSTDGGSPVSSQTVASNSAATAPAVPTKSGYAFFGWYTEVGLTNLYSFSTPVTGNRTLYARWESCTPQTGFSSCTIFGYTGADQTFTVPAGVTIVQAKAWGAAGGNSGGGGGYTVGTLTLSPGTTLKVVVGGGGQPSNAATTYGGGGGAGKTGTNWQPAGSGGGLSGLWNGTYVQADALLVAGGGGGGGNSGTRGGAGGGSVGLDGAIRGGILSDPGRGGTQSAGGIAGSDDSTAGGALIGGKGGYRSPGGSDLLGAGGGGGYFGGGGSGVEVGAGGGSGYCASVVGAVTISACTTTAGVGDNPADTLAPYVTGVGVGGGVLGGSGLVVLQWNPAPTVTSVSPDKGQNFGGTALTITGTGFLSGATVTVGGVACTSVSVVSTTSITCKTAAGSNGVGNVAVSNADTQIGTLSNGFTYAGYTKIANNGTVFTGDPSALPGAGPTDWACTRDDASGLVWEVKTADSGLRGMTKTYTNYYSGYSPSNSINATTNSIGFANAVNDTALCGSVQWRMPTKDELLGIVKTGSPPTIETSFFPNTTSSVFWSGSPYDSYSDIAWSVDFRDGGASSPVRSGYNSVRLVRGGPSFATFDLTVTSGTGSGSGSVTTGGINCAIASGAAAVSSDCTEGRGTYSVVTLTATPASGSLLTGWSGACSGTGITCSVTMNEAKSVTANFDLIQYSVTFDANGGSGSMSAQNASSATALSSNSFTRAGYTFAGWNTDANGSGTAYGNGASFPFAANTTLYAQWSVIVVNPDPVPTPTPEPDPTPTPDPSITTLPTAGGNTTVIPGQTITFTDSGTGGSTLHLGNSGSNTLMLPGNSGGIQVTPGGSGATLTLARLGAGGYAPTVASGSASFTASAPGQNLLAVGGIVVSSGAAGGSASATVDADGNTALIVSGGSTLSIPTGGLASGTIVHVSPDANGQMQPITIKLGDGSSFTITPQSAQSSFSFMLIGGTPVIQLLNQAISFDEVSAGTLLAGSVSFPVRAGADHTRFILRPLTAGQSLSVLGGFIQLPPGAFRSASTASNTAILPGETLTLSEDARVQSVTLGSGNGVPGSQAGDPLTPPALPGLTLQQAAPRLSGSSERLQQDLFGSLRDSLGKFGLQIQGQADDYGRLLLQGGGRLYSTAPVGSITVDLAPSAADGLSAPGNGDYRISKNTVNITLAPILSDLSAFATLINDSGGSVLVQTDGSYLIGLGGTLYAAQAGYAVSSDAAPGLDNDARGYITFATAQGQQQTLYPVAADFATLAALLRQLDPQASTRGNADGSISLMIADQHYTLLPDYALVRLPAARANDAFWVGDDGRLYLKLNSPAGYAQGFWLR